MPDFWNRQPSRDRSWDVRDLREDYGQADYSRDYVYDKRRRTAHRVEPAAHTRDDFGQADFSRDYEYDPHTRTAVRREELHRQLRDERPRAMREGERADDRDERRLDSPRTWFGARDRDHDGVEDRYDRDDDRHRDRRGVHGRSDESIWREVMQRLADDRRLEARDIEVDVRAGEVTLRGQVEDRDQKRRAEDLADVDGVVDVHNHLTLRDRRPGDSRPGGWRRGLGL
ncbi:MAG: BON domain-containing protein [Phenylobacterium sp.]